MTETSIFLSKLLAKSLSTGYDQSLDNYRHGQNGQSIESSRTLQAIETHTSYKKLVVINGSSTCIEMLGSFTDMYSLDMCQQMINPKVFVPTHDFIVDLPTKLTIIAISVSVRKVKHDQQSLHTDKGCCQSELFSCRVWGCSYILNLAKQEGISI